MPVKSKQSAIVVDRVRPVRKIKSSVPQQTDRRQETRQLLDHIKVRGEQLSAEIKELLVRMS